jgi:hypothetical protein
MNTESIDSKFDAGKGAGDIFQKIMSGMETQVRADLLVKFTKFAASLRPRTHYAFRRQFITGPEANESERRNADKLMMREEMPDPYPEEVRKAHDKAVRAAMREESSHKDDHQCRYSSWPESHGGKECVVGERLNKR